MLSRRDALQLIAAFSAASTLPSSQTSAAAASYLNGPVPFDVGEAEATSPLALDVLLPGAADFADGMTHRMWDALDWGMFGEGAPQEWAEVEKLMAAAGDDAPDSQALRDLSVAVVSLAIGAWYSGARVGAELEGVRRSMLRPIRLCSHCWGSGREVKSDPAPCSTCHGAGTVPSSAM